MVATGEVGILRFAEKYFSFLYASVHHLTPFNPPNYRTLRFERETLIFSSATSTKGAQHQKIELSKGKKRRTAVRLLLSNIKHTLLDIGHIEGIDIINF